MPAPTLASADTLLLLRMKIGDTAGGWIEDYILDAVAYADALPLAAAGCWFRTAWFGNDVSLLQASVSFIQPAVKGQRGIPDRKAISGIDFPSPYNVAVSFPWPSLAITAGGSGAGTSFDENDPFVGAMFQRETPLGRWARMILRGLPDNYIQSMRWKGTGTLASPQAVPAPFASYTDAGMPVAGSSSGSLLSYQQAFLTWVLYKTYWHRANDGTLGPLTGKWYYQSWDRMAYDSVRKLNLGQKYGAFRGHVSTGR